MSFIHADYPNNSYFSIHNANHLSPNTHYIKANSMLVHKNYQRVTVLHIDCNLSVACWCTAHARYAVLGQTESSWDTRVLPVMRDAVPFTLSIYKKLHHVLTKSVQTKIKTSNESHFMACLCRSGAWRACAPSSSFLLRRCFRTTLIYMDSFIQPGCRKTIYNHDYLDCILLSKQSQEKKGSVFSL